MDKTTLLKSLEKEIMAASKRLDKIGLLSKLYGCYQIMWVGSDLPDGLRKAQLTNSTQYYAVKTVETSKRLERLKYSQ